MDKSKRGKISDEEAKRMLEEILMEDKLNNEDGNENDVEDDETDELAPCAGECARKDIVVEQKFCECMRMAENASRFSLRVMEAMRRLQREGDTMMPTSSAEDIVDYIQANYRDDGDLYAQVRTALKQVCSQGYVMELLENEYHLIGPDAISMNEVTCSNERKNCSLSSSTKRSEHRKNDNDEDACGCDTSSEDEAAQRRKSQRRPVRDSRRMSRNHRDERADDIVADEAADSSSVNLTDDECVCGNRTPKSGTDTLPEQMPRGPYNSGDTWMREERQAVVSKANVTRRSNQERRGTARTVGGNITKDSEENEALSQTVDDIYRELEEQNPGRSIENEKELKQWIKRCQEECKRRKRRRDTDN